MNFPGIRSSKFRHVYGLPAKKEKCYENLRITRNAHDGNYCAVNPKFLAVVVEVGGGGSFVVLPLSRTGRMDYCVATVTGHQGPVLDVKWNPFNDNVIASASEDCRVRLWQIPEHGLSSNMHQSMATLSGHRRRVGLIEWHPTAENILVSAGYDHLVIVWDTSRGVAANVIQCHTDTIYSMSFNRNGSLLATTCKDKKLRILDPRTGEIMKQGFSHQGTKASKVAFIGSTGTLFTTGFSKFSDRQLALWSETDLSQPLKIENIDSSSGILNPVYDHDSNMVYVFGKGDGNIRYYEVLAEAPWVTYLSQLISGEPQKGFGVLPKRGVNASACELFRFYKLHATKDVVEPISMIVPRKSSIFQADIFPDTSGPVASLTAEDWLKGENALPTLISMRPGTGTVLHTGRTVTKSETMVSQVSESGPGSCTLQPQFNAPESHVISDKNNDKKFYFLSRETQPDYTRKQLHKKPDNKATLDLTDNKLTCSENIQNLQHKIQPKSEKDIKTSLNLGTRLQQNVGNFNSSINYSKNKNNSVKCLTNKFDYNENKNSTKSEIDLKQVVNEQTKLISNLREQLQAKDQKIKELEANMKLLLKNIPPKLDLSLELNGHSLA